MKYQNLPAFEKHLQQAAGLHLSRVFVVVAPCSYERRKIVEKVVAAISSKEGEIRFHGSEATPATLEEGIEGLNTASLLGGKQVLYLDAVDKLKKNGFAPLAEYAAHPSPFGYLILGAASGKALSELYTKGKKELIACDLSEEKPWDRKDRLKRMLVDYAARLGSRLSADSLEHLLEHVGLNLPGLEQEIDKLITYAAERKEITLRDVHTLCAAQKSTTLWQLADVIAWRDPYPKIEESVDLSLLLPLFAVVRTQLQQGMTLSLLLERGTPHAELAHYLPSVKSAALDKMLPACKARRSPFFKRALDVLFEAELMAKNSSHDPALILDLLLSKLTLLKKHHALSAAQSPR